MRTTRYPIRNKSRRTWYILAAAMLLLAFAAGGYYVYHNKQIEKQRAESKARDEAQTESAKKSAAKQPASNSTDVPTTSVKQDVPEADATVTIQSVNQTGGAVTATATSTSTSGTCVFTYTIDGDKPVTRNAGIEGSTCTSSVPEVEFARLGTWNLNVTVYIDGKKTEANQSVTIN